MKPADFIAIIAPIAVELRLDGSPIFPSLRIAQAAHETGWQIHSWNNLVGLKVGSGKPNAYWDGSSVRTGTWEVINGQRVDTAANWRAYRSIEDCFRDQDELFKLPRYARVRAATTPEEQADMLQACGYATDPAYGQKLKNLIGMYNLKKYDQEAEDVLKELQSQIRAQQDQITELERKVRRLEGKHAMSVPEWAKEAVDAAVKAGIVDTPEGGSYDFYRVLTVMHRKGLI
jgi:flagellar protein FlgJ